MAEQPINRSPISLPLILAYMNLFSVCGFLFFIFNLAHGKFHFIVSYSSKPTTCIWLFIMDKSSASSSLVYYFIPIHNIWEFVLVSVEQLLILDFFVGCPKSLHLCICICLFHCCIKKKFSYLEGFYCLYLDLFQLLYKDALLSLYLSKMFSVKKTKNKHHIMLLLLMGLFLANSSVN